MQKVLQRVVRRLDGQAAGVGGMMAHRATLVAGYVQYRMRRVAMSKPGLTLRHRVIQQPGRVRPNSFSATNPL
ncbi:MAG TPA: hypothetical protein VGX78_07375, partial [Pirellulales bacterium]|nr:hypothetical protein [Pirellulales bacterium]